MKDFKIYENGFNFAIIRVRTPVSALRKAADQCPRHASDYNVAEDAEPDLIEWRVIDGEGKTKAVAKVTVPGRGQAGCTFVKC